jgi:hypothetical protein
MPGYIYLIMMADGVYKVGRTKQDYGTTLKRLRAYPGDSVIVMVQKVYDDVVVEKEVLRRCRLAFGVHPRGLEYFKGLEDDFMKIIYECKNFRPIPPPPVASVEEYPVIGTYHFVPIHRYDECGIIHVIAHAKVDQVDFLKATHHLKWFQHATTHQVFATFSGERVYLQDIIKEYKGPWVHINGDPWDFTNKNLVKVTTNIRTIKRKSGTAGVVGVCFVKSRNRWKATLSGKLIGYFKTEEDAAAARLKKVLTSSPPNNN